MINRENQNEMVYVNENSHLFWLNPIFASKNWPRWRARRVATYPNAQTQVLDWVLFRTIPRSHVCDVRPRDPVTILEKIVQSSCILISVNYPDYPQCLTFRAVNAFPKLRTMSEVEHSSGHSELVVVYWPEGLTQLKIRIFRVEIFSISQKSTQKRCPNVKTSVADRTRAFFEVLLYRVFPEAIPFGQKWCHLRI